MPRKPRIIIPDSPAELIKLGTQIYAQHRKLGSKSPLNALEEQPSWDEVGPKAEAAQQLQATIEQHERDLKTLYGQRQQLLDVLLPQARSSRDLLTGVYSQNLRRLGDFGFEVVEAAESKTAKPAQG